MFWLKSIFITFFLMQSLILLPIAEPMGGPEPETAPAFDLKTAEPTEVVEEYEKQERQAAEAEEERAELEKAHKQIQENIDLSPEELQQMNENIKKRTDIIESFENLKSDIQEQNINIEQLKKQIAEKEQTLATEFVPATPAPVTIAEPLGKEPVGLPAEEAPVKERAQTIIDKIKKQIDKILELKILREDEGITSRPQILQHYKNQLDAAETLAKAISNMSPEQAETLENTRIQLENIEKNLNKISSDIEKERQFITKEAKAPAQTEAAPEAEAPAQTEAAPIVPKAEAPAQTEAAPEAEAPVTEKGPSEVEKQIEKVKVKDVLTKSEFKNFTQDDFKTLLNRTFDQNPELKTAKFTIDGVEGYTFLDLAARSGNIEAVKYLVETQEFNPNEHGARNKVPLTRAAVYGQEAIVEYLLTKNPTNENVLQAIKSIHDIKQPSATIKRIRASLIKASK